MKLTVAALLVSLSALGPEALGALAYPDPAGGWTYLFNGDQDTPGEAGSGFTSLDGAWSHDNGSDEWDGSKIGGEFLEGNSPGGVMTVTENGITYLRIQDTGDPRDYGYVDPGSNRKVYFGHDLTERGAAENVLDDGVTLAFRARIPTPSNTTAPLDPWHRDGQQAGGVLPYPAEGDGYVTSDGGKGNFVLKQAAGGAIAFSLTVTNDTTGGGLTPRANFSGLTMNENAGNVPAGNQVNFGMGTGTNVVAFNPTEWHEFWIVLRKDPSGIGTHQGFIYMDGSLTPHIFSITAGTGDDYAGISYLAIGMTATPQNSALDIDFVAYKLGAEFPTGAVENLPPQILNLSPTPNTVFHPASSGVSFNATATANNSVPPENIKLLLNERDVSASLTITGTAQNRSVTYAGLEANAFYTGQVVVADQQGRASTNKLTFDTFSPASTVVIEAEDYNHSAGQFQDNPLPGAYQDLFGLVDADYSDTTLAPGAAADHIYRTGDNVSTRNSLDYRRPAYVTADRQEVHVALIQSGEWLNYTRTFPNDRWNVYLRSSGPAAARIRLDQVTSDRTQPNQTTAPLGTFEIAGTGNDGAFAYTPLTDAGGNPVAVNLSGVQTIRLTAVSASDNVNLNFLVFVPARAMLPTVSLTSPTDGATFDTAPASVTLTASASATGATVSKVEFFVNATEKIGEAAAAPYTVVWNNVGRGSYALTARVTDSAGQTATSVPVRITVGKSIISAVVETGGDGEETDTVTAKWTGNTFSNGVAGEFLDPFTVPHFGEDVPAFVDRTHQWNGASPTVPLPAYLVGGEYIMSGNDNRDNSPYQLDVTVSEAVLVYVLVDNRLSDSDGATPPDFSAGNMSWLLENGWTPVMTGLNRTGDNTVPDEVGMDEGGDGVGPGAGINQWSSIYRKSVPAGTFTLLQADNAGQNMYGVVVTSATPPPTRPTLRISSPSGNSVTITWTGAGKLQEASDVNGAWTDVSGNPQGSVTVPTTGPRKFYRVVVP